MEITDIKKVIKRKEQEYAERNNLIVKSERYYANKNDILMNKDAGNNGQRDVKNPLKVADNRIANGFYPLLLNQKSAYTMTVVPTFDVDDEHMNEEIIKLLGNKFHKVAKDLCIEAGNSGVAWLHVWKDNETNFFEYAMIDSKQVFPVYSNRLGNQTIEGMLRIYNDINEQGDEIVIYEYWNDKECQSYSKKKEDSIDTLAEYNMFNIVDNSTGNVTDTTNVLSHDWGRVPFIKLANNSLESSDLVPVKALIDVYDKVFSGFVNDIDDIQEVIFILTNYGGEDRLAFLRELRETKTVKVEADADGAGKLETLSVDIPIEARTKLLDMTRDSIFVQGQGVDPQKNISQNNSGVALKYMYSLLELKASMLETEFREGFADLIKFIMIYSKKDPNINIKQKWTRTAINDELEQAEIVAKLSPVTSDESIAKSNPLVEDWQAEVERVRSEQTDENRMIDDYKADDLDE